jgi:hypothetical protein
MRYQNFSERTRRLHEAAQKGGWKLHNASPSETLPIWVATHPKPEYSRSRVAWAMMHGNEPTGFEALLQFIKRGAPKFNWTLIPMVNPTGVDAFSRLTIEGVDLNRCARRVGPVESDTLKSILQSSHYELALNLHDQRSIFHPTGSCIPSSLSILAPAAMKGEVPSQPELAIAWAGSLSRWMREFRPDWGYARFDESYYPTAFGEWVQELGIPTVTVETGVAQGDASRATVGDALFEVLCKTDAHHAPHDLGSEHYLSLPFNAADGCDFELKSGTLSSYWKLWEVVQEGGYASGIERVESAEDLYPYQRIEVAHSDFNLLAQRPIWTTVELYASAISSLRDLAEVLPR